MDWRSGDVGGAAKLWKPFCSANAHDAASAQSHKTRAGERPAQRFNAQAAPPATSTLTGADWVVDLPWVAGNLGPLAVQPFLATYTFGQYFTDASASPRLLFSALYELGPHYVVRQLVDPDAQFVLVLHISPRMHQQRRWRPRQMLDEAERPTHHTTKGCSSQQSCHHRD